MPEQIIVDIDPSGNASIEVKGAKGKACKDLTAGLEKALGKVTEVQEKPEINQRVTHGRTQEQK